MKRKPGAYFFQKPHLDDDDLGLGTYAKTLGGCAIAAFIANIVFWLVLIGGGVVVVVLVLRALGVM
jgi:hypothetical protein